MRCAAACSELPCAVHLQPAEDARPPAPHGVDERTAAAEQVARTEASRLAAAGKEAARRVFLQAVGAAIGMAPAPEGVTNPAGHTH